MNIEKGIKPGPAKVVIYGPEGIGKTTLASKFPRPLFLDLEKGSTRLNVERVTGLDNYPLVKAALTEFAKDPQGYQTLVIDTGDKLDNLIIDSVVEEGHDADGRKFTGIEDYGYGKGYTYVKEKWCKLLDNLTVLQNRTGVNIVFVCHAWQRKVEQPGTAQAYDHYELKLIKQTAPLLKEWGDFLFFCNYNVNVEKTKDGKTLATGGQRFLYTNHTPYYDAKSRAELPERLKMDDAGVATVLKAVFPVAAPAPISTPAPVPTPAPTPAPVSAPAPASAPAMEQPKAAPTGGIQTERFDPQEAEKARLRDTLNQILKAEGYTFEDLELATSHPKINMRPKGTPLDKFSLRDLQRLTNGWEAVKKTIKALKGA